jgi:hypothetical protein
MADTAQDPDVLENIKQLTLADADVPMAKELDLDSLPAGRISKVWVVLFEDALKPMTVPVIIAKGIVLPEASNNGRCPTWSCRWDDVLAPRR